MSNVHPPTRHRPYLPVGSSALPSIYFLFCVVYAALAAGWVSILLRKRTAVFRIHYFMLAVLVLKGFNLLAEAEDKSYIERTGTAHGWDVLFYIFSFLKGISLFTLINLREAARSDGKAAVNLMKLTLFRQYYVVVICYIYFTRVVVYALVTITSYRYLWTSVVAGEIATLAFYVFTGYRFRPEVHNPYFAIDDDEEEAAAEALKLDDEFEL
uniref:GOST seven transmembrane domain-containing protein n=1 Tax=Aegilops tauschii TaxID=37682 RepID=M8BCE2_AEGTA